MATPLQCTDACLKATIDALKAIAGTVKDLKIRMDSIEKTDTILAQEISTLKEFVLTLTKETTEKTLTTLSPGCTRESTAQIVV